MLRATRRRCRSLLSLVLACLTAMPPQVWALPSGGQVVSGSVTTSVNGAQMTLNQASRAAIMNWQQFNIAPNELVRILQSGSGAAMLARVTGGDPSALLGQLKADGKLFLINPRGILVGAGAVIDTAAFVASTLDIADQDFLAGGPLRFKGTSDAGIVNLGRIQAREGNVMLFAHTVKNAGEITAPMGSAGLAAGTEVYLASADAPAFVVKANLPAAAAGAIGVDNAGTIAAARAQLQAAGGSIYDLAVNQGGVVRATGVEHRPDGRVLITAEGGTVAVGGTVSARNANGSGGEILVGGDFQGKNPEVPNALRTAVLPGALLDASADASGDGGRVIVWADDETRYYGRIEARGGASGGNGGFAEVSGKRTLGFSGTADLSAPAGTQGNLLLDPDDLTIVEGTTALPTPLQAQPYNWQANQDPGSQNLGATSLAGLLATGNVNLQVTNRLTVGAAVTSGSGRDLSLRGSDIRVLASVDVGSGKLTLEDNATGPGQHIVSSAAGATLKASTVHVSGFRTTNLAGPVSTSLLRYTNLGTANSFAASNASNAIAKLTISTDPADPKSVAFSGDVAVASGTAMNVSALLSAPNVTFSSRGNLTLLSNDGLDPISAISSSGTVKLAATDGGVFINQAGANLLSGTGRRAIYTSSTGGAFSLGGMTGYPVATGNFPGDPLAPAPLVLYTPGQLVLDTNSQQQIVLVDPNTSVLPKTQAPPKLTEVKVTVAAGAPITPLLLRDAIVDFGPGLGAGIAEALKNKDLGSILTKDQVALLAAVRDGKLSLADLAARVQNDPVARGAIMPVLMLSLQNALQSGQPLSSAQQALASRVAANINTQRQTLARELNKQVLEYEKQKQQVQSNNPFALKTMPDIAISAQQAAFEQGFAAALGAGAGAALGAAAAAAIYAGAAAIFPFAGASAAMAAKIAIVGTAGTLTAQATAAGSAASTAAVSAVGAAAAAGAFIAIAAAVAIGVVSAVMVGQEKQNISAFNVAQERARTQVDLKLSGFNLGDATSKTEFATAFMMTMLEIR